MKRLLANIASAVAGLYAASLWIEGVAIQPQPGSDFFGIAIDQPWKLFLLLGIILGLLTFFIKPVLDTITLPLRIITLGLFSIATTMAVIWILDYIFQEISIPLWLPLFWTALIVFGSNLVALKILTKND